jgi:cytochrome c biogenesis protein CcmG/thiol:disulfide interchange protein DsbE
MRNVGLVVAASVLVAGCATPQIVHDRSGARTTLEELKGHAVVVTFWADYCRPCLAQMPVVLDSVATYGEQVVFLPVFVKEKPGHALDAWLQEQPEWFREQICWANDAFLLKYDRTAMPRTYVYGRNGKLVEQFEGRIDQQRAPIFQASLLRALAATK